MYRERGSDNKNLVVGNMVACPPAQSGITMYIEVVVAAASKQVWLSYSKLGLGYVIPTTGENFRQQAIPKPREQDQNTECALG
jgi:hypothetical protein